MEGMQYRSGTKEVHHQHGRRYAVWICHTFSAERHSFSTDARVQYKSVKSLVRMRVCSTGLPKLLKGLLVVVFTSENDILQNLDFILLWLYPDVAEIPVAC